MRRGLSHDLPPGSRVGLTTTIPVEVVLAAGLVPVDLNNLFIASPHALEWVAEAEAEGLPRTICAWIKGIYAALGHHPEICAVIAACQGDCSYTQALGELLASRGVAVLHFNYPYPRQRARLARELAEFMAQVGTEPGAVAAMQAKLAPIRQALAELDRLTWETGQVSGRENFLWLIASSDFEGHPDAFAARLTAFLQAAAARPPSPEGVRLGLIGIPPIFTDLWEHLEELGARVVFNEIPRQFSLPGGHADLTEQYYHYTYPYDITLRLRDIARAVTQRRLQGLIHYTQSFCFRQMYDRLLREKLRVPLLTLEGDRPGPLDSRSRMRLEAFVDVLR
ncbi:MAG: 2-hydroxyacyl-CoA dehydratase [Syntrophobacterales bacterium]|nr:2-hydroxyacyl-CoA dehydratase [Syntrophobacterales bacterium]